MRCTYCFSVGPLCLACEALRNLKPSVIYKRHPHPHKLPALADALSLYSLFLQDHLPLATWAPASPRSGILRTQL